MEFKQPEIVRELRRRIDEKIYTDRLPTTLELAAEFGVNPKTINKAMAQLVADGLLERRKRSGTQVRPPGRPETETERHVEIIFESFSSIFTHPFWKEIWAGVVETLAAAGYRTVLTLLEANATIGLLKLDHFSPSRAAGRILLGVNERRLINLLREDGTPFIIAGDQLDDAEVPQVAFDFTTGFQDAVDFLVAHGCAKIGFIGQTQSYVDILHLHKYESYLRAIQRHFQIDPDLIENARPLADTGAPALARLLDRSRPDAIIAAYDHHLPEMMALLRKRNLTLPIIGCDGQNLPQLPPGRPVIRVPLRECGQLAATRLLAGLSGRRKVKSQMLQAEFIPEFNKPR